MKKTWFSTCKCHQLLLILPLFASTSSVAQAAISDIGSETANASANGASSLRINSAQDVQAPRTCSAVRTWVARWMLGLCLLAFSTVGMAAISVSGAKSVSTGATAATSLVITPIAAAVRADLLLVQLTLDSAAVTVTPATGWAEITGIAQNTTGIQQRVYWKIRSNTEPANYTWSFSASARGALIMVDLTGVDTNQAINASSGQIGSGTSLYAPEVASAYTNGMIVGFFGSTGVATAISPQASMTVPASGSTSAVSGANGVQLALAYEQVASDGLTGLRTATGTTGNFVGQTLAITPAPPATCFSENFNRASLGADWVASNSKGGFNPTIVTTALNQRLQLTQNANNQATLAILQRYFPAAGNNVVVSFKQYAYPNGGGTGGADGIVTIFSDASVSPVAGGSGGSMGYAQYNSPAASPGFAGGWLGVGIDEYGNFSNPSENRYLGPGARTNSVAIRGPSNSFYTSGTGSTYAQGYPYVAGTASLTPILGSTTATASGGGRGDLYRITIDSRIPGEQWVQVERSTDGGGTYTAHVPYFNLMSSLQGLTGWGAVTLPAIPANFWLSFSGGTGGAKNFHEIDDLQVCATKMIASTAAIDHFRFENPSTMDTCQPKAIKVTACTDAAPSCTQFTGGDVYVTLKPAGWVGGNAVKLIGGKGTLQLAQSTTGTVTLDIDKTKTVWPALKNAATYASECVVPGTSTATNCNLTVSAAAAGFGLTFPSTSTVACDDSGDVSIKACSSGYAGTSKNLQFWFSYTDPSTTADATRVLQVSKDAWATSTNLATTSPASAAIPAPINVTFDGTATAKIRVKYPDVGKVTLNVRDSAVTTVTGSGILTVRPSTFVVTAVTDMSATPVANPAAANATGTKFVAAGTPFKVTVEARNNCSPVAVVKNFGKESTPEGVQLTQTLASGLGLSNNPALTTTSNFSFTNGVGTATVSWPEVGILTLTPRLKFATPATAGSYMGTVDVIGTQSGNIGRFYAHHLDTVVTTQGCSAFTYDRQPMKSVNVSAKASGGSVALVNYRGSSNANISFAKAVTLTDSTGFGTIAMGGAATVPVLAFSAGSATLDGVDADHPQATYTFTTNPTAPKTISIAAADADNSGDAGTAGVANIRSGRIRIPNAYGSERLPLPLSATAQYYDGTNWATNTLDNNCTLFNTNLSPTGNLVVAVRPSSGTGFSVAATSPGPTSFAAGMRTIILSAPGIRGSADISLNTPSYLSNTPALATFGIFKSPLIYRRENY